MKGKNPTEHEQLFLGPLAVWRHTPPSGNGRARVLLIHGISEHSGRHRNTYEWLIRHQFEVVRFDLRGSGESGGRKQWISRFNDYVEDTANVFNWICRQLPPIPLFVHGHSLGGAIATHFAAHYGPHLRGLSLSAPAYLVGGSISATKITVGRFLATVAPTVRLPNGSDFAAVSRDPKVVEAYQNDPLAYHFNTLQQGNEVLKGLEKMPEMIRRITLPLLMVHGTADRIIRPSGSFGLLKVSGSADKQLHYFPSGYHEPHNDLEKETYFQLLTRWFQNQLERTDRPA
jgi:alpha-beta hydrolase superfamily lysophospholipase